MINYCIMGKTKVNVVFPRKRDFGFLKNKNGEKLYYNQKQKRQNVEPTKAEWELNAMID